MRKMNTSYMPSYYDKEGNEIAFCWVRKNSSTGKYEVTVYKNGYKDEERSFSEDTLEAAEQRRQNEFSKNINKVPYSPW